MAVRKAPRKRATSTRDEVMYGGPNGPGLVALTAQNIQSIGALTEVTKTTQRQLNDPETGLIYAVNKMAEEQKADRLLQAKLHATHDGRWRLIQRVALGVLVTLALVGLISLFPQFAKVLPYLPH